MLKKISKVIDTVIDNNNTKDAHNIEIQLQRRALNQTAQFVEENMSQTKSFPDKFSLLKYSLNLTNKNGLFMEFGVYKGLTLNFIASNVDKTVYGFDSFEGLPENWRDGFEEGTFKLEGFPEVKENVKLVKGWFEDSLPNFISQKTENCSFIHIDCDLYSSAKTIFKNLNNKIEKGTIIIFDEFFNYPGWKNGEYKAFMEFIQSNNIKFEYIGYCRYDEQVAVKILKKGEE